MTRDYFVLTAVGPDRPGLMDAISEYVFHHQGNVEASRAATLGGEFAVVMLVSVEESAGKTLEGQLAALTQSGLTCTARRTAAPQEQRETAGTIPYVLTVHAMDHPGIVQAVTHELATMGVNIESLETHVASAPHTGTAIFHFHARLDLPARLSIAHCRQRLAGLAEQLNVDFSLAPVEAGKG